jgi:hypothetical protein
MFDKKAALAQMDEVLDEWQKARAASKHEDLNDLEDTRIALVSSRLASVLGRFAPSGSQYFQSMKFYTHKFGTNWQTISPLSGALLALRRDYELGYLSSIEELVHADTFSGLLEMAAYLQESGYKDAAAVIAGSVLEQHLRELAKKNGINVMHGDKFKKAETLNAELAEVKIYSKLDQKNVTSWLGLRNDAAHGNYKNYTMEQAKLMQDSVANFLTRNPA